MSQEGMRHMKGVALTTDAVHAQDVTCLGTRSQTLGSYPMVITIILTEACWGSFMVIYLPDILAWLSAFYVSVLPVHYQSLMFWYEEHSICSIQFAYAADWELTPLIICIGDPKRSRVQTLLYPDQGTAYLDPLITQVSKYKLSHHAFSGGGSCLSTVVLLFSTEVEDQEHKELTIPLLILFFFWIPFLLDSQLVLDSIQ